MRNHGIASVKQRKLPLACPEDEAGVRSRGRTLRFVPRTGWSGSWSHPTQHQFPRRQFAEGRMARGADQISRTAVYVTRMHGGVGGGRPRGPSIPIRRMSETVL